MHYTEIVKKFYDSSLLDSIQSDTNEYYNDAKKEKQKYLPVWNEFVAEIRKMESVTRIRDTYYSSYPDTGKITIGLNENCEQGVTFNLSFRIKQMGIYYCHYKQIPKISIKGQPMLSIDLNTYLPIYNQLSYYPFSEEQERFTHLLIEKADTFFQDFKLFNNIFAAKKAQNVIIDMAIIKESDYFQVFFDNSMDGIS